MAETFIGEIRIFAGTFAPVNWAFCDGQLINIQENEELYSLLSTTYGGNGTTTFGLPDLRGRLPMHQGTGLGLSPRAIGSRFGQEHVTLSPDQIPAHRHPMQVSENTPTDLEPAGHVPCKMEAINFYDPGTDPSKEKDLAEAAVSQTGESDSHYNLMPFICVNYIIALRGTYPSRN